MVWLYLCTFLNAAVYNCLGMITNIRMQRKYRMCKNNVRHRYSERSVILKKNYNCQLENNACTLGCKSTLHEALNVQTNSKARHFVQKYTSK